jgi:hypothetical protein
MKEKKWYDSQVRKKQPNKYLHNWCDGVNTNSNKKK